MGMELNSMVMAFIFLLVGVTFIGVIANESTSITQQNTVVNETVALVNQSTLTLANNQLDSFTSLVNSSNASQTYVLNTDYTVDLDGGKVTSLSPTGAALATYVYRDVGNSTARTLINLILIFFAIGLLMTSAGFAMKGLRESGVL